jgi:hypothetical protein
MPRGRWIIAVTVLIALLVAVEFAVRRWERPKACVQIVNEGDGVMEDLVVSYGDTRLPLGRVLKGHSVLVWLTAGPMGPLRLDYRQKSNAIQGFQIPDFDPAQLIEDGNKQVLVVGSNLIQRSVDDDETRKDKEPWGHAIWNWLQSELKSSP